jgi:hypothetical protein
VLKKLLLVLHVSSYMTSSTVQMGVLQIHTNTNLNYKFEWTVNKSNKDNNNAIIFSMIVTPGFKAKPNAHSMCAQETSLHTYRIENGYRITDVTV